MSIWSGFIVFFILLLAGNSQAQKYEVYKVFDDHQAGISVMTKDPARRYLIAGDTIGNLYFRDYKTGELVKAIKAHGAGVTQLRFNSTGKLLISATEDGEIKIFDFSKDKIIQAIFSPSYSGIRFVQFSIADGFVYFNGKNKLYKTRSDLSQKVFEILTEYDTITDAVITNDRSALIYATGSSLKVLNTRTDVVRQEFYTGPGKIMKIALVMDSLIASWSMDGTIFFWHYSLGQINPQPLFFLKAGLPTLMSFTDDGKLMSAGNIGKWSRIWKPMERAILQELFAHTKTVTSSCFGETDDLLFTGSLDGKIILWKVGPPPDDLENPVTDSVTEKVILKDSLPKEGKAVVEVKSEIEMSENNIPKIISGRNVTSSHRIDVTSSQLTISVFDNSTIDGDTMSLFFNGTWILDHYGVTKQRKPVTLNLVPNTNNYLVLFANNLGKSPPNTAVIEFDDGKTKRLFRLTADLKSCSAINFYYKK